MAVKVGTRVIAARDVTDGVPNIFGKGVFEGNQVPEGEFPEGSLLHMLKNLGAPSPAIKLDSGEMVYGCECWWGSEEGFTAKFGTNMNTVSLADFRAQLASELANNAKQES